MIQINAFTSAQAGKLATDSKTSYEGLEASRIQRLLFPILPIMLIPVMKMLLLKLKQNINAIYDTVAELLVLSTNEAEVRAEVNVTMIKSKDIQSSLASINVNASKVTTNEMFANTKLIQYLIPMLKSNLKKRIWISGSFLLQKQLKITLKRKMIT